MQVDTGSLSANSILVNLFSHLNSKRVSEHILSGTEIDIYYAV
jgi:hypothetical protein